jgi:hypothetical protein
LFELAETKVIIILMLFLSGCGANPVFIPTLTPTVLAEKTNDQPTKTLTLATIIQETESLPTNEPAPTIIPTALASWTPQPTLAPDKAEAYVLDLIATNGGCRLPCWWGITPGETTWEEAHSFLETFATSISTLSKNLHSIAYKDLSNSISDGAVGATISVNDCIVETIETDVFYPLSEVLTIYGQPKDVRISVDSQSIDPLAPFVIALYYEEQGFLAVYRGKADKGVSSQICPSAIAGDQTVWFLWSPKLNMPFEKAGRQVLLFVSPSDNSFRKLEESTNMDVRRFYETYRNAENGDRCFEWYDRR